MLPKNSALCANILKNAWTLQTLNHRQPFLPALRTESTRKQLQQTITAYEQNLAAATDRLQRAQNAVNGKTEPELSACKAAEQQADALYRQLTAQTAVTAKELSDLQKAQLQLQELEKKMGTLQDAYQTAASLAETARGNNPSRLTFSRICFAGYFHKEACRPPIYV